MEASPIDFQFLFNLSIAVISGLIGVVVKALWDSLNSLRNQDTRLANKVNQIELLVAGNYVKKDDFNRFIDAVSGKLDRIEEKVGSKADRRQPWHPPEPPAQ